MGKSLTIKGISPLVFASTDARERFERLEGEGLMHCAWRRVLMIHYAVPPQVLQPHVPFELDTFDGTAWVSLVPFGLHDLRIGRSRLGELVAWPLRDHRFLNVRTYVKAGGEAGIYFLAEWVSNRLAVQLGPLLFGLPYRFGELDYRHEHERGRLAGTARSADGRHRFVYSAPIDEHADFKPCAPAPGSPGNSGTPGISGGSGGLDAFLMERYTAFTARGSWRGLFRIQHDPWPQVRVAPTMHDVSLLRQAGDWFASAKLVSANYSPGVEVRIGRPRTLRGTH